MSRPSGPRCSQSLWALQPQGPGPSPGEEYTLPFPQGPGPSPGEEYTLPFPQQCPGATAGENAALGSVGLGVHMGCLESHRTYGNETAHKVQTCLLAGVTEEKSRVWWEARTDSWIWVLEDLQKLKAKGRAGTGREKELCILLVVVQSLSRVRLSVTPWTTARQASLSFSISRSLLKFMSIELVMPSNHLVFCRPLLLLPLIFPCLSWSLNLATCP